MKLACFKAKSTKTLNGFHHLVELNTAFLAHSLSQLSGSCFSACHSVWLGGSEVYACVNTAVGLITWVFPTHWHSAAWDTILGKEVPHDYERSRLLQDKDLRLLPAYVKNKLIRGFPIILGDYSVSCPVQNSSEPYEYWITNDVFIFKAFISRTLVSLFPESIKGQRGKNCSFSAIVGTV